MSLVVYIDGAYVPKEQASVSVYDHGLLYGDGIFEGIRAYNGRVFKLDEHLRRLKVSAQFLHLELPLSLGDLREAILETLRRNELRDGYVRVLVTRGKGDLGLDPRKCARPMLVIIADSIQLFPPEVYEQGVELATASMRRPPPDVFPAQAKSLNYLNSILAKMEAIRQGFDEAIMLSTDGYVAECTGDNIFLVRAGGLVTPPPYASILEGVTRNTVIQAASQMEVPVHERLFTLVDVYSADECFLTGTAAEMVPVVKVDGRTIADGRPGPMTMRFSDHFRALTQTEGVPIYE
jgi:branched-chain amino acid aminotransferase